MTLKLDHLTLPVANWIAARDWYVGVVGLKVEFEIPERFTVAVQDQNDFTIFLEQSVPPPNPAGLVLTFQVADVHGVFEELTRKGVPFKHPPQKVFWGYGTELRDPDGYTVRLWDQESMMAKG